MKRLLLALLVGAALWPQAANATCQTGRFLNPITDICWQCVFPIWIGGVEIIPSDQYDPPGLSNAPVAFCPIPVPPFTRPGIPVAFWEPARIIETVKDPYCFPTIGNGFGNPAGMFLAGSSEDRLGQKHTFGQVHYYMFPIWAMMEVAISAACMENTGFDVAYITEIDPLWQDDEASFIIHPDSLLAANPVAQFACALELGGVYAPLDFLPQCIGAHGMSYPMTGHVNDDNYVQANTAMAERMIYKMGRELLLCDPAVWNCACIVTPVWVKSHYRLQNAMPVRDFTCRPIGRTGLMWAFLKNPPFAGDNFSQIMWRKHECVVF